MISYTCAKTNVPIKAIEMGIGTDHPRHLVELRYWRNGDLRKVRGHLVGDENCIKGIGSGFFLLDLTASGLHDEILVGNAFVLAASLCGEVPDDFRGRSHDDPAQGGLMMPEDLDEYIDERGHLPSHDAYMMLYCENLSVEQARTLPDAILVKLASVNAFTQNQIAALTDAGTDWSVKLKWSVAPNGAFELRHPYLPALQSTEIRTPQDAADAAQIIARLTINRENEHRIRNEYKVPSLSDLRAMRITNKVRAISGLEPLWAIDVDPDAFEDQPTPAAGPAFSI